MITLATLLRGIYFVLFAVDKARSKHLQFSIFSRGNSLPLGFGSHICPLLPFLRQPGKCFAASSAKLDELASFFSICRQFETIFSMRQAILECY